MKERDDGSTRSTTNPLKYRSFVVSGILALGVGAARRLAPTLLALGLLALLSHGAASRGEALLLPIVTHNDRQTPLNAIQTQLDQIPPAWSQALPAAQRFELVLGGEAVLDHETGLVWEQSPSTNTFFWHGALSHCNNKVVGSRKGWRLPVVQELASLVDPNNPGGNPALPPGHPFNNVQLSVYCSATNLARDPFASWSVFFANGNVGVNTVTQFLFVWCVRGGHGGPDAQ